jgi:hypothetical protein
MAGPDEMYLRLGQLKGRNALVKENLSTKRLEQCTFPESEIETEEEIKQTDRSGHSTVHDVHIGVISRLLTEGYIRPYIDRLRGGIRKISQHRTCQVYAISSANVVKCMWG